MLLPLRQKLGAGSLGRVYPANAQLAKRLLSDVAGMLTIVACLEAGIAIQSALAIPVPGSILGMVVLLAMLCTGVIREGLLTRASGLLLFLLPALFVPIYVRPLADPQFWVRYGALFVPAAVIGASTTLLLVAYVVVRVVRR